MRRKSHIHLGKYLIKRYMQNSGNLSRRLFLFGCIQPDMNPLTYLKGSLRYFLLRGHHYHNAKRYMERISTRLEKRKRLHTMDYYTFGKLIHYTADAFTYAHNDDFSNKLSCHRKYEKKLQEHFLYFLRQNPVPYTTNSHSIMESIRLHHRAYSLQMKSISADCAFTVQTSCCVMSALFQHK